MSLLEVISKKYNGKYFEEALKSSITSQGKIGIQKQEAVIKFDNYSVKIGLIANFGAAYGTSPYRVFIKPNFNVNQKIEIEPRSWISSFIFDSKYKIRSNKELKNKFKSNDKILGLLENGDYYISSRSKNIILLSPSRINSIEEADNIFELIEELIYILNTK